MRPTLQRSRSRVLAFEAVLTCLFLCATSCIVPLPVAGVGTVFIIYIPGGTSRPAAIKRAYLDRFKCSSGQVRKIARNRYEASGCGPSRTYTCRGSKCTQDEPDFDTSPTRAWVDRTHRETHGCSIVSVWPVGSGLYEARGCGPTTLYYCPTYEDSGAHCRVRAAGDPLPAVQQPAPRTPRKKAKPRRHWR